MNEEILCQFVNNRLNNEKINISNKKKRNRQEVDKKHLYLLLLIFFERMGK